MHIFDADTRFNIWGVDIGMISNTAFPIRNIYVKKLSEVWDSSLHKYAVISICGVFFLLPILLVKVIIHQGVVSVRLSESLISGVFHCTYNLVSIKVLESFNPVTHAILNMLKRFFVVTTNIMYFHTPISWNMVISLVVLLISCYLYYMKSSSKKRYMITKCLLLSVFMAYTFSSHAGEPPIRANKHVEFLLPGCLINQSQMTLY